MGVFLIHVSRSLLFVVLLCIPVLAAGLDFWRWKEFRRYFSDFYDTKSLNNNINLILRRGQLRLLRVRDFLNTENCLRVNQRYRYFDGKTWLPPSFNYELQRECRSGRNKFSNVRSFIILLSGEGLTSFTINNRTKFFDEKKKRKMKLSGFFFRTHANLT